MICFNKRMELLLAEITTNKGKQTKKICELNSLLIYTWPSFYQIGDCILFDDNSEKVRQMAHINDFTGFEAFHNHIHVDNISEAFINRPKDGFRFSKMLFEIWESKLKRDFPNERFTLILSYDGKHSTLRFHKRRENEYPWIDKDKLEDFREAIMISEFCGNALEKKELGGTYENRYYF